MRDRRQSGQVAVETAIVLPLFVFLILGTLQLGLMHQARLMAKYAAYKAVRAGALHNADVKKMERAALAVLLPMISRGSGGTESMMTVNSAADFQQKWMWPEVMTNRITATNIPYAKVTICGPVEGDLGGASGEVDFDNPEKITSSGDWKDSQRSKLRIQLTFNYRMVIPFADVVIYNIARAKELPYVIRLGKQGDTTRQAYIDKDMGDYDTAAGQKVYVVPIRATYTMRMQSNLYLGKNKLPKDNTCLFSFQE
ncbi:pilus assembly protein [Corallococcus sp. AB049A]|uniref:Pilus assembly protein n=1 Tax=Corallococcus interemptor TaxID=2316720 RepID=A0A3A8QF21_9BACT|nr:MULTISPECIES: TadE/TadG family type IV pilus assembly protein [Corallococcus]RKH50870.1 pilus assembly protein [Corallococcus sp. AB050B]RKH61824.1 pilus assembly protein [Corallococcus interemptor]RKI68480.1 pilus assembly protein [Corallococcus sp. AB049A]